MLQTQGEPFSGRVDDVAWRHAWERDGCQSLLADGPTFGSKQPVAGVNDDWETGLRNKRFIAVMRFFDG